MRCLKRLFMLGFETQLLCPATHCSWRGSVAFRANCVTPHSGITTSEQRHTLRSVSLCEQSLWCVESNGFVATWVYPVPC